jgi:hypothetical protein
MEQQVAVIRIAAIWLLRYYTEEESHRIVEDMHLAWVDMGKEAAIEKKWDIMPDTQDHIPMVARIAVSVAIFKCDNPGDWKRMMHMALESEKEM